jgi:hypothetical protein
MRKQPGVAAHRRSGARRRRWPAKEGEGKGAGVGRAGREANAQWGGRPAAGSRRKEVAKQRRRGKWAGQRPMPRP